MTRRKRSASPSRVVALEGEWAQERHEGVQAPSTKPCLDMFDVKEVCSAWLKKLCTDAIKPTLRNARPCKGCLAGTKGNACPITTEDLSPGTIKEDLTGTDSRSPFLPPSGKNPSPPPLVYRDQKGPEGTRRAQGGA